MTPEDIMRAYPRIYPTPPRCGFDCPDGWLPLVAELSSAIERATARSDEPPYVQQIKEKYGSLRAYVSHESEVVHALIDFAERLSVRICERCGAPGKQRQGGWIRTLCETHAAGVGT